MAHYRQIRKKQINLPLFIYDYPVRSCQNQGEVIMRPFLAHLGCAILG